VERWYQTRGIGTGATVTLEQAWQLGRVWYGDRLSPDWRRRTPEEAKEVFERLGLTGDFWSLTR